MTVAFVTLYLEVLHQVDSQHVVLARESAVLHLYSRLFAQLVLFAPDFIVIPERLLNKVLALVISVIGKKRAHWSDNS